MKPYQPNYEGQKRIGEFEKAQGWRPAPQQANESWTAYQTRVNQHGSNG